MDLHLHVEGARGLADQLYRQLRAAIVEGRLRPGDRLPSTRELAVGSGVSRKTTLEAYERLLGEGFLQTRPGDGTFVAAGLGGLTPGAPLRERRSRRAATAPAAGRARLLNEPAGLVPGPRLQFEFLGGVTDKPLFPFTAWRRCLHQALRWMAATPAAYREPAGDPGLREAISQYLAYRRGMVAPAQAILVTQGAQQALDLIARTLVRPGDVVAVEDPGYPPARACFTAAGARVVPVPVDAEGLCVDRLPARAKLVYVTPSHQFPLGMPMSLERRLSLLQWSRRCGARVIEDDYDSEFRFEGRSLESLKTLDRDDAVLHVGTFSKTLFPELRLGYLVPPATLMPALCRMRQMADWHGCTLTQQALAVFMADGEFSRHLRRMHRHYAARRRILLDHLSGPLSDWLEPIAASAGIHLVAQARPGIDEDALIEAARDQSVGVYGLRAFHAGPPVRAGLLFGYGGIGTVDVERAMARLRSAFFGMRTVRGRPPRSRVPTSTG